MTIYLFGAFRFDAKSLKLTSEGEPVKIRPKCSEVLAYLLEHQERPVSKEELLEQFWPDLNVSENVLFQVILDLRNALSHPAEKATFIKTFPKKGYQWLDENTKVEGFQPQVSLETESEFPREGPKIRAVKNHYRTILVFSALVVVVIFLAFLSQKHPISPAGKNAAAQKIAVFSFKNLTSDKEFDWIATALAEVIRAEVNTPPFFYTLTGQDMQQVQSDLNLTTKGPYSQSQLRQIRDYLPCRFVVNGSFLTSEDDIQVHWYLEDVGQGKKTTSGKVSGNRNDLVTFLNRTAEDIKLAMGLPDEPVVKQALPNQGDALRFFAEGIRQLRVKDAKSASAFFEQAVSEEPNSLSIKTALSQAYAQLGDRNRATNIAKEVIDLSGDLDRKSRLTARANLLEIEQNWPEAAELYQALWIMEPGNTDLGIRTTTMQIEAGNPSAAEQSLKRLFGTATSGDPRLALLAARIAKAKGDYGKQLEQARIAIDGAKPLGARSLVAEGFLILANGHSLLGNNQLSLEAAEQAAAIYHDLGHFYGYSQAKALMGNVHNTKGTLHQALPLYTEAMAHYEQLGNLSGIAQMKLNLSVIEMKQRRFSQAAELAETAVAQFRGAGSQRLAGALAILGLIQINQRAFDQAIDTLEESNFLFRKQGNLFRLATNNSNLALIYNHRGDIAQAIRRYETAVKLAKESGKTGNLGTFTHNLGQLCLKTGRFEKSRYYFHEAIEIQTKNDQSISLANSLFRLAKLDFEMGRTNEAISGCNRSRSLYESNQRNLDFYNVSLFLARIHLSQGNLHEAERLAGLGSEELVSANNVYTIQYQLLNARLAEANGDPENALQWLSQALSPERVGRQSRQTLEGQYLKAGILIGLGRVSDAQTALKDAEPSRIKEKNVLVDMERELLAADILLRQDKRDLAHRQWALLSDKAKTMGAARLLEQIEKRRQVIPISATQGR